jgi:plastocyanin
MKIKHFAITLLAGTLILFFSSCSKSDNTPAPPSNGNTINITGMSFPANTTVTKGSTVVWNNKDGEAHTVTSDDGSSFNSGTLEAGGSFSYVANTVGSFPYHCNFHSGMKGTLTVTQ